MPEPTAIRAFASAGRRAQPVDGLEVRLRMLGQDDALDVGDPAERLLDPPPEHRAGGRIADDREAPAELERADQLGLAPGEAVLDDHGPDRRNQRLAIVGVAKLASQEPAEGVSRHHRPRNIGRRLSKSLR